MMDEGNRGRGSPARGSARLVFFLPPEVGLDPDALPGKIPTRSPTAVGRYTRAREARAKTLAGCFLELL